MFPMIATLQEIRDARKMLEGWTHGLHRVVFYGNHMADDASEAYEQAKDLALRQNSAVPQ